MSRKTKVYTREFDRQVTAQDLAAGAAAPEVSLLASDEQAEALWRDLGEEVEGSHEVVSILVSLQGWHRLHLHSYVALVDLMARTLERAGRRFEVLGHTTTDWKGGPILPLWQEAGRPRNVGRLSPTLHIVFKDASQPWSDAGGGLSPREAFDRVVRPPFMKEGIEGEAVDWAVERLKVMDAAERGLWLLSKGRPGDEITDAANGELHLALDLGRALDHADMAGVRVTGLCIAHDRDAATFFDNRVSFADDERGWSDGFDPVDFAATALRSGLRLAERAAAGVSP